MDKTILLIATHDTKEDEARFLKSCIQANGFKVLVMDTGILAPPRGKVDIPQSEVAARAGTSLEEALQRGDKRECTEIMCQGAARLAMELFDQGRIRGVIGIGGAQGTEIASAAMRALTHRSPQVNGLNGCQWTAPIRILCGN